MPAAHSVGQLQLHPQPRKFKRCGPKHCSCLQGCAAAAVSGTVSANCWAAAAVAKAANRQLGTAVGGSRKLQNSQQTQAGAEA